MSNTSEYWKEPKEQSLRKSHLVANYFSSWLNVMLHKTSGDISYVDLFSGPGVYENKIESTPIRIIRTILEQPEIIQRIRIKFNDGDAKTIDKLRKNIQVLPSIELLTGRVSFTNHDMAQQIPTNLVPPTQALLYLDPYGIEGLTLNLFKKCIDGFGKDVIIFFSYDAINRFFNVETFNKHILLLFGEALAIKMSQELKTLPSTQREGFIIDNFINVLKSVGAEYVLPYRMIKSNAGRTGYYIVFASKHYLGRKIMSDIMKSETEGVDDGQLGFNPNQNMSMYLFEFYKDLPNLCTELINDFSGCRLSVKSIFEEHSKKTSYTEKEYRGAFKALENNARISVQRPSPRSPAGSFAENAIITFI